MRLSKKNCGMCKSNKLEIFLDLGFTPLADGFLKKYQLSDSEKYYPLRCCICLACNLVQLDCEVSPDELYKRNYPYVSSITKTGVLHFHSMAESICKKFGFGKGKLAIDIGSNIGVLLEGFKKQDMTVLGVDPAPNIVKMANERGINTLNTYFNSQLIKKILKKNGKASVITGTNVFAHIGDLDDLMTTVNKLLEENGIFVIEVPYLVDLINNLEYDTIYHEHLRYISLNPLIKFVKKFMMEVFDVERSSIHGGTIRVFMCKKGEYDISINVKKILELEEKEKIHSLGRLKKFEKDVKQQREDLIDILRKIKKEGKSIAGLSSPAKGNTLLNFCGIGTNYLDFITEKTKMKLGLYTPGTHIKIVDDFKLVSNSADYALLLAWNFKDEIIKNCEEFQKNGGKFIIPIPSPKII